MNKNCWQMTNDLTLHHRLAPIQRGLTCWWKIADSQPLEHRKIGYIDLKPKSLIYIIAQQTGLLARIKTDPALKSP